MLMISFPAPFAQAWTPDNTRELVEQPAFPSEGTHAEQERWRREVGYPSQKAMAQAIGRHLAWLIEQGKEVIAPDTENLRTPFLSALRELRQNPNNPEAQEQAGRPFENELDRVVFFAQQKHAEASSEELATHVHAALLKSMEEGNFKVHQTDTPCQNTGLKFVLVFREWASVAATMVFEDNPNGGIPKMRYERLKPEDAPKVGTETASIPMPSGHLLIADWVRIPAFHDLIEPLDDATDIGSIAGRAARTRAYAETLGVIHVFGRSPSIFSHQGVIKAGYNPVDDQDPSFLCRIEADLRWTTMVDRQHLVSLLTPALGLPEAEKQVQEYEQTHSPKPFHAQVEPGTHHLYFSGDPTTFANTVADVFQADGLYLDDFSTPSFVLTDRPLQPALTPTLQRRPKP
jgi:hypothetical protein